MLIKTYYDIILQVHTVSHLLFSLFAAGNIALIAAFVLFSHSEEYSFKIRRQLNLLGLILSAILVVSFIINYRSMPVVTVKTIIIATIFKVINLSVFIIGLGIYWMGIWKRDLKRKTVFIILLFSSSISFVMNNFYFIQKMNIGESITGGYPDIFITAVILLFALAAWHEVTVKEQYLETKSYNLFNVSRIERIIPLLSLIAISAVMYFHSSKLESTFVRHLIILMIPYFIFLFFSELYSYRSEDALLSVLSVSPTGIHITDRKFRKTYFINKSLSEIFRSSEISPDLITGNTIPEELKRKIIDSVSEQKTLDNVEMVLSRSDGTCFNAQCKIVPAKYYSYNIVILWIWDITDRKKYEGMILQQKNSAETTSFYKSELLDNLSNRMQSGYVTMKLEEGWPDFIFTGMNKRILEIFNFKNDVTGRRFRDLFPDPNAELVAQFIDVLNTGISLKRELQVRRISKYFMILIFKASEDEVACLIDDITDSKYKERVLVERERELSALLGNLPGMVYRCRNDKEWTMYFVSQGSLDLSGYKPEELVEGGGVCWNDLIHPDDREKVWLAGQDSLKKKESYYLDYRIITKDLSIKYVWEKGAGVFDENDELLFLEGFIFDITKQKEAENVLRENEMRTKEIEKARALGQMAGGIAHDLNNRLMGIGSYTSLIDIKVKDLNIKKYTEGIQESVLKSSELIDDLLTFARQSDIVIDIFSIHSMLREIILKVSDEFPEDIKISSTFNASDDNVRGDSKQIFKAVFDIVSNAKDAMPLGGDISICTENKIIDNISLSDITEGDAKKKFIVIKISDSGIGIEKENLNRIFDPFYTTKPVGKGTGLGLSAVYGAIQSHKGAITVDSTPGKGTLFSVYLPVILTEV